MVLTLELHTHLLENAGTANKVGEVANGERTSGPVLIADNDAAFVAYLEALLETAGYRALTASTGREALSVAQKERPLLVLLEIDLPIMNGYEVCRALRDEFGQRVAVAFVSSTRTGPLDVSSGLLFGADDYLVKPFDRSQLLARVCALIRRVTGQAQADTTGSSAKLTKREFEVLCLLAEGCDQRDIAQTLSISPRTVGLHIEHILTKLGVHSRAEAVAAAYRERLVALPR